MQSRVVGAAGGRYIRSCRFETTGMVRPLSVRRRNKLRSYDIALGQNRIVLSTLSEWADYDALQHRLPLLHLLSRRGLHRRNSFWGDEPLIRAAEVPPLPLCRRAPSRLSHLQFCIAQNPAVLIMSNDGLIPCRREEGELVREIPRLPSQRLAVEELGFVPSVADTSVRAAQAHNAVLHLVDRDV